MRTSALFSKIKTMADYVDESVHEMGRPIESALRMIATDNGYWLAEFQPAVGKKAAFAHFD